MSDANTPEERHKRVLRNKARRWMIKKYGKAKLKGKHVDHIIPITKGGKTDLNNLRILSASKNSRLGALMKKKKK